MNWNMAIGNSLMLFQTPYFSRKCLINKTILCPGTKVSTNPSIDHMQEYKMNKFSVSVNTLLLLRGFSCSISILFLFSFTFFLIFRWHLNVGLAAGEWRHWNADSNRIEEIAECGRDSILWPFHISFRSRFKLIVWCSYPLRYDFPMNENDINLIFIFIT